ncbi:MAG: DNRLRE domain-containing protein [Phycisphaerae bacterium]|nr:DNRLRE domain-containing protein [Phycisphaerae bacterium]
MKGVNSKSILSVIICTLAISAAPADTLIYNNSTYQGSYAFGYNYPIYDYGTSAGGLVSKIVFGYYNPSSSTSWATITFYRYPYWFDHDPGYIVKTITVNNLPPSTGSYRAYEHVLPEQDRFELPSGNFGYTIAVSSSSTGLVIASGGSGQQDELWEYYNDWLYGWDWYSFSFTNAWSGLYMKIYTAPPIDAITCDISGSVFDDADGDGTWDGGEAALPSWEIYVDTNGNDLFDPGTDPNVVTDPNGLYFFENLDAPATYTIREVMKDGWTQTLPGGPDYEHTIDAEPNNVYGPYDFGNAVWAGTQITLNTIADTYADQGEPDTNYGNENVFFAGTDGTMEEISYIKFDLSTIPPGQVISSAVLQLNTGYLTLTPPVLGAYRTSSSWEENTLTWNDKPSVDTIRNLIEEQTPVMGATQWDVTDYADDEYVSYQDDFITIAIAKAYSSPSGTRASFWSKDVGVSDWAPKLVIQYEPIFGGGTGERSDPYQIKTGEHMNTIGLYNNRWNKHYKLMNDISLSDYSGTSYNIIGRSKYTTNGLGPFTGTFDGGYYQISGFSYSNLAGTNYAGLFGYVSQATIRNVIIVSPNIQNTGNSYDTGALVGNLDWSNVADCSVEGGSVAGDENVGGLIGSSGISCIAGCSNSASVSGTDYVGGLIGLGGFSSIANSNATGSVTGTDRVGGFVGESSDTTIVNCYSTGQVTGSTNTGGFSGINENEMLFGKQNVFNCFWNEDSSGQSESAVGIKSNTADMQTQSTFTDVGWDFVGEIDNGGSDDWAMPPGGGYPVHWYQLPTPPTLPSFAGGDGTEGNPYQIETTQQLNSIGHNPRLISSHFQLVSDMDMEGLMYHSIAEAPYVFTGTFDGGQHSVSNIRLNYPGFHLSAGFMGQLEGTDAVLKNIILTEPNVFGTWSMGVGSLLGRNTEALVDNCHVINTNVAGWNEIGGLVGQNYWHATINNCTAVGGTAKELDLYPFVMSPVGGLVGINMWWSQMDACSADVDVLGQDHLGGLVGRCVIFSDISNSCARGAVTTTEDYAGGLCYQVIGGDLTNCYSSAQVIGPAEAVKLFSFVSSRSSGTYTSCLWDESVNGSMTGIEDPSRLTLIDVGPESTENMQMAATYQAIGWDFESVWQMRCEGMNYPRLRAEPMLPGDFVCPEGVEINDLMILTDEWLAETMSADMAPDGGDGKVNLADWAHLADAWMTSQGQDGYDPLCDLAPETPDGSIDELDLSVFANQWLHRNARFADIAPIGAPDGKVDLSDYCVFAENWLLGTD